VDTTCRAGGESLLGEVGTDFLGRGLALVDACKRIHRLTSSVATISPSSQSTKNSAPQVQTYSARVSFWSRRSTSVS